MPVGELLFLLLRSVFSDDACGVTLPDSLTEEELDALFRLAKGHDILQLAAHALEEAHLLGEGKYAAAFRRSMLTATWRVEKLAYEYNRITAALEEAEIPYIPLKGVVLRPIYPEPWMRVSCDIDILVHEEDLDRSASVLAGKLNYTIAEERSYHDLSLFAENGVHLELHFNIRENMETLDPILDRVWEYSSPRYEGASCHLQSNEFLLFHLICHMAYHFTFGGCGIRPFLDLYLLRKKLSFDERVLNVLLAEAGLVKFYDRISHIMNVWFDGAEHTEETERVAMYILGGGVYGSQENKVAVDQVRLGGNKVKQVLERLFMPYEPLCTIYPQLKGKPRLTLFYQVRRWFRLIRKKRLGASAREFAVIRTMGAEKRSAVAQVLDDVGLR